MEVIRPGEEIMVKIQEDHYHISDLKVVKHLYTFVYLNVVLVQICKLISFVEVFQ